MKETLPHAEMEEFGSREEHDMQMVKMALQSWSLLQRMSHLFSRRLCTGEGGAPFLEEPETAGGSLKR